MVKIFTKKQYNELVDDIQKEFFKQGYDKGHSEGFQDGFHKGLTKDKNGVYMSNNGMYIFKEDRLTKATIKEVSN
ncbi:hypothetical protein AB0Y20_01105 [Heyndrickxia oleronia]|uniref:hypothetical protein n=1 Tax=Heyndrickxia oleronia TaxID=38875 RepID=UPI003F1ECAEE